MSEPNHLLDPNETFATLASSIGLHPLLTKALTRLTFSRPTLVQSKCLPLAISHGRDLLVRARTGSGKTLAYSLPILHKILSNDDDSATTSIQAVVLVPTRELCAQVETAISNLLHYADHISITTLVGATGTPAEQKALRARQAASLRDDPDLIIGTPSGILHHKSALKFENVASLVIDEADLVLSFGYGKEVNELVRLLPDICQGFILSATLGTEVESLKRIVLHSPAVLQLEEEEETIVKKKKTLSQFYLPLPRKDKNLVLYVFLKLGLLKGKGLFFVNSTDAGYRLKLFWEQFHIRSAVLNAELPVASRMSILEQFNAGNFDYLIATDESSSAANTATTRIKDSEYGVSRGLDFRNVSFVVNVDFPATAESYTHRIGRTARAGSKGVALSLVEIDDDHPRYHKGVNTDLNLLQLVQDSQATLDTTTTAAPTVTPSQLQFDLKELEGFRYRVEDVQRAVTKVAVKETRASELTAEILNSERLQNFFEDNPKDLQLLRHDRTTHVSKVQAHLKHVPKYMLPKGMAVSHSGNKKRKRKIRKKAAAAADASKRRTDNDPLQAYEGTAANDDDGLMDGLDVDDDAGERAGERGGDADAGGNDDDGYFDESQLEQHPEDDGSGSTTKRHKGSGSNDEEKKMYLNTTDGTGRSTSGRRAWAIRHGKGKHKMKQRKDGVVGGHDKLNNKRETRIGRHARRAKGI